MTCSPHGSELLDENNRLCGDLAADSERRFQAVLTRVVRRAAQRRELDLAAAGVSAADAAQLLMRSVSGLKGPGVTVDTYRARLAALVRIFVAGLGGRSGAAPQRPRRSPRPRVTAGASARA